MQRQSAGDQPAVAGMEATDVIEKLKGIRCGKKSTSCPINWPGHCAKPCAPKPDEQAFPGAAPLKTALIIIGIALVVFVLGFAFASFGLKEVRNLVIRDIDLTQCRTCLYREIP